MIDLRCSFLVVSSREAVLQRKPRLRAEHGIRARAGAIGFELALVQDKAEQIEGTGSFYGKRTRHERRRQEAVGRNQSAD